MSQDDEETPCITSIPLKYTYFVKPVASANSNILHETNGVSEFWRKTSDTSDTISNNAFWGSVKDKEIVDCLPQLRKSLQQVKDTYGNVEARISEDRLDQEMVLLTFKGKFADINNARAEALRSYFLLERAVIRLSDSQVHDEAQHLDKDLVRKLDDISSYAKVSIFVTDSVPPESKFISGSLSDQSVLPPQDESAEEISSKAYYILIYGDNDAVEYAKTRVEIVIDHLDGKFVDYMKLDLSIQTLVVVQSANVATIESQSKAKVYFSDPVRELLGSQYEIDTGRNYGTIFFTGEESNVALAKALVKEIVARTPVLCKDCVLSFAKLDLICLKYQSQLREISRRFGTFIQVPYVGASRSIVRVQGSTEESIENTITALMQIAMQLFSVLYWVHTGSSDESGLLLQPQVPMDMDSIEKIAGNSSSLVCCKAGSSFDIVGHRSDAKRAAGIVRSLPLWDGYQHQITFRLEMPVDLKDFIAGKGNGKIHRVMRNTNVWIKFEPFNEHNFYITLTADDYSPAATGIQLLEDELPAETDLYVPESYHKHIIGTGGSNIQGIMRKYNVFIKFSHGFDGYPNGFAFVRPNNVVIRCPAKNAKSIPPAKLELLEAVKERDGEYCNTFIYISRSSRRILLSERSRVIYEIERKTGTIVNFPLEEDDKEPNVMVEIRGSSNSSEQAAGMLKAVLPDEYEFKVAQSPAFQTAVDETGGEFSRRIIVPFRVGLRIEVQVFPADVGSGENFFHKIVLSFSQENSGSLEEAIQVLTSYLREREIDIVDRGVVHNDPVEHGSAATAGARNKQFQRTPRRDSSPRVRSQRSRSPPRSYDSGRRYIESNVPAQYPPNPVGYQRNYDNGYGGGGGYDPRWTSDAPKNYQPRPGRFSREYY
jgi:KH domain